MQQTTFHHDSTFELPTIRRVSAGSPFQWLAAGWRDFLHMPISSGFYGLVFALLGYAVTAATWQSPILVLTFVTGFFLIAPFLALGLYELSRQRETGEGKRFVGSLLAFRRNKFDMGLLVVFHAVVMIAWIRLATLIGALYFSHSGSSVTMLFQQVWSSPEGIGLLALFLLIGGALAALVFVTGAVSWPMVLHRSSGVINAMATSIQVVRRNKAAMAVWAALIVALFALGVATLYLGLIIIIPVLGHATWHAYRALVE
jgi:uncharacterized membrane protein